MVEEKPIARSFHETALFQKWMTANRIVWPADGVEQERVIARYWQEGMAAAASAPDREWTATAE